MPPFTYLEVHFNFLGSLFNTNMFFLHLEEQNTKIVPSFLANIIPDPKSTLPPQNLQV